jgi:hypothetical protein
VLTRATKQRPRHGLARFALTLAFAISGLALNAAATADELKPFEASYTWMWHGMTVALSTLRLERNDDTWTYSSKSEPRGIGRMMSERPTQRSVLKVTDTDVRPLSYKADDGTSSTKRDADVVFDWEHGRVSGVYEDTKLDMPLPPGIQDDLSVQIALMAELLKGRTPEEFSLLSGNSVRKYRYTREGTETLVTPAGTVKTIIYSSQKEGSPRVTRFWCASSLGYIPLRVQQQRDHQVEWTMQIQSLTRE